MRNLFALLLLSFLVISGCKDQAANDEQKQEHQNNESIDIQPPNFGKLEATFNETLFPETNVQSKVKELDTKEEIEKNLGEIIPTEMAKSLVDQFYEEKSDGLYVIQRDGPIMLMKDKDFEKKKITDKKYEVIQTAENELRGNYTLTITYQYENDHWIMSERKAIMKNDPDTNDNPNSQSDAQNKGNTGSSDGQDDSNNTDSNRSDTATDQNPVMVENTNNNLVLVNKSHHLPGSYVPNDLIEAPVRFPFEENLPKKMMRKEAAYALKGLFQAADHVGLRLYAQSGYRSYDRQEAISASNVDRYGGKERANQVSAEPGESEHQSGLAMDVTSSEVDYRLLESFEQTEEGQWLKKNASQYGFIIRYPNGKTSITGYSYEPWHIRYVGKKAAQSIYSRRITLEEYLGASK